MGVCESGSVDAKYLVSIDFNDDVLASVKWGTEPICISAPVKAQWKRALKFGMSFPIQGRYFRIPFSTSKYH